MRAMGVTKMHRPQDRMAELPFGDRLKMLRRARRRIFVHQLTDNILWVVILVGVGAVVATELIFALARA